jgi:hypothetical protein
MAGHSVQPVSFTPFAQASQFIPASFEFFASEDNGFASKPQGFFQREKANLYKMSF